MFTAIITVSWRGFGWDKGKEFIELRLGFVSFSLCKGTLWQCFERFARVKDQLISENTKLRNQLNDQKAK
ncbi:hypothetical protein COMNV_01631 [Commensalibacter sp. Nvir]|uniref:hypothetical protein n=1 Tax=Commensalibacter sp. Nvir TaxID=3069817 RepID=UPI002D274C14|nr:hypothetical protein COMNV_01631 [Commensalibacter sp. Nvir]